MKATREKLSKIAAELASLPFHGNGGGEKSNIAPLIAHFPKWSVEAAEGLWCAAFVYHCCLSAGYEIPYSPDECVTCSLAGCGGWDEFARGDDRIGYYGREDGFTPDVGDIVLFDRVFCDAEHDHIGIVLKVTEDDLTVAEGNIENRSQIMTRPRDEHIRAFIRLPDGYKYKIGPRGFLTDEEKKNMPKVTKGLLKRIFSYLKPYWVQFVFVFVAILLSATVGLFPSIITGRIVDQALVGEDLALLIRLLLMAFGTVAVKGWGYTSLSLGCVTENEEAVKFWKSQGFCPTGDEKTVGKHTVQTYTRKKFESDANINRMLAAFKPHLCLLPRKAAANS